LTAASVAAHSQAIAAHSYLIGLVESAGGEDSHIIDASNRVGNVVPALDGRLSPAERLCDGITDVDPVAFVLSTGLCRELKLAKSVYRALLPNVTASIPSISRTKAQVDADLAKVMRDAGQCVIDSPNPTSAQRRMMSMATLT
jgi:hypothetical protein